MRHSAIPAVIFIGLLFAAPVAAISQTTTGSAAAQNVEESPAAGSAGSSAMTLDVVVTDKSGALVTDMQPGDFKLLDNKQPQTLASVELANGMRAKPDFPVEAIVLVDGINPAFQTVANERQWLTSFFKENGGELALPTSLIVLTDAGMKVQEHPSRNGGVLLEFLNASATGLRAIRRSEGLEGVIEREKDSLNALDALAAQEATKPGRKLLIWVGPGWGLFSNASWDGGPRDEKILFNYIVSLSAALHAARITIYSIDPTGAGRGQFFYESYLKGVDEPKHADYGDLLLQVLAGQSGGQVLFGNNDLASLIDRCVADAKAYYALTYIPPPAAHTNEYHRIDVQVDKPGLNVRTRAGYYSMPNVPATQSFPKVSLQTVRESSE
jgi:VWFA-related protein